MKNLFASFRSLFDDKSPFPGKLIDAGKATLQLDALEPRVLFSAAPVEAPDESVESVDSQAPAEEVASQLGSASDTSSTVQGQVALVEQERLIALSGNLIGNDSIAAFSR